MSPTLASVSSTVDSHGVALLAPEFETVPEHPDHARIVDLLAAGLMARFREQSDVAVHSRIAWFPDREDTRVRLDPDVMVVMGRAKAGRSSYRAWNEEGVPPTVLIEVVSRRDTAADYDDRLGRARVHGVREVVLIDPFQHGGTQVTHLVPDPDRAARFMTAAVSVSPDAPITVSILGITLAGGPALIVRDEQRVWPDVAEAFAASARVHSAEAEVERLRAVVAALEAGDER